MAVVSRTMAAEAAQIHTLPWLHERWLERLALTAVAALAAGLRLANLSALGYANHYYAAAVQAMMTSWHDFIFVAAEPGGSVSVDKPPVGLWLQVMSAKIFGVNGLGLLLPEILAGLISVLVLYHLVRRRFGPVAGLVASLALAITPVVVATDRNNTMDSTLILTLLLAAYAFIKATETTQLRYLILGAVLVGIGFNIKMLEAFLPLPAFFALYLLGARDHLAAKIAKLALTTVVLLVISFSWATAVDLTPADQRPYVGSSSDNSEWSLILGYNGVERLLGMGGRGGLIQGLLGGNGTRGGFVAPRPGGNGNAQAPQGGILSFLFGGGAGGAGGRGGFFNTGYPGPWRLFITPLSNQMSWLLPFGMLCAIVLALGSRIHWSVGQSHQALVLWGGWLVTGGVFFSIAGFFHEYYLSILAPPLAALVGIGIARMWDLSLKRMWLAASLLVGAGALTIAYQYYTATVFTRGVWWMPLVLVVYLIGAASLIAATSINNRSTAIAGFAGVIVAIMITPGIWSALTNLHSSTNQSLPAAYNGGQASFGPAGQGGANTNLRGLQIDPALLAYLQENTKEAKYLMAVPSSMQGADYVIATGRPVLYLGGFDGRDPVETPETMAQLVASGELRYVYLGGRGGFRGFGGGGQASISSWVTSQCALVQGYDTTTENQGAPDGTRPGQSSRAMAMPISLYRCGG